MKWNAWNRLSPTREIFNDVFYLTLLCVPLYFFTITTLEAYHFSNIDTGRIFNQAQLLWQGVQEESFVYNIVAPLLIGGVDLVTKDVVVANMIVATLLLHGIVIGTYLLGRCFYQRRIGWLAALIIVTNPHLATLAHSSQTYYVAYICAIVWLLLAFWRLIHHPSSFSALLLGFAAVITVYARLEGMMYALLIVLAVGIIYYTTRNLCLTIRYGLIAGGIFTIGFVVYVLYLFEGKGSEGSVYYVILYLLGTNPIRWDIISLRVTDTFTNVFNLWPLLAWWVVLVNLVSDRRYRFVNGLFAGLIAYQTVAMFILAVWPSPHKMGNYLPFFALLVAAGVWHMRSYAYLLPLAPIVTALIILPGIIHLANNIQIPPFAYKNSSIAQDGPMMDAWVEEQGWSDTTIWSFCYQIVPYSRSHLHLIYRLLNNRSFDSPNWWNSPTRLLPSIRENNELLMTCGAFSAYYPLFLDWMTYFKQPDAFDEQLREVGHIGDYVFYEVVHVE